MCILCELCPWYVYGFEDFCTLYDPHPLVLYLFICVCVCVCERGGEGGREGGRECVTVLYCGHFYACSNVPFS